MNILLKFRFLCFVFALLTVSGLASAFAQTWIPLGLENEVIQSIRTTPKYIYACTGRGGLFRISKANLASRWEYLGFSEPPVTHRKDSPPGSNGILDIAINPSDEDILLIGRGPLKSGLPGIYRSTDGGKHWAFSDSGFAANAPWWNPIAGTRYVQTLFIPSGQSDTVFAGSAFRADVFRSTDFGRTWHSMGPSGGVELSQQISCFAEDPSDSHTLYAGGSLGESSTWFLQSKDRGTTWTKVLTDPFILVDNRVNCINVSSSPRIIYLSYSDDGETFRLVSRDSGLTWSKSESLGESSQLAVDPFSGSHLVSIAADRFQESFDAGVSWTQGVNPIKGEASIGISWDKISGDLITSFPKVGVYMLSNLSRKNQVVRSYELYQNYPNPFNPTTVISYLLKEPSDVHMNIFDIIGKEVATLVDQFQLPGQYRLTWDGTDQNNNPVSTGSYFLQLRSNHDVQVTRMMLIH